jgi:hypothetical protein
VCFLVVDSTLKERTGHKHPLGQKGSLNEDGPYVFGLHLVVVVADAAAASIMDIEVIRRCGYFCVKAGPMIAKCHAQDILEKGSWSMYTLTRHGMWQLAHRPLERAAIQRLRKAVLRCKTASSVLRTCRFEALREFQIVMEACDRILGDPSPLSDWRLT